MGTAWWSDSDSKRCMHRRGYMNAAQRLPTYDVCAINDIYQEDRAGGCSALRGRFVGGRETAAPFLGGPWMLAAPRDSGVRRGASIMRRVCIAPPVRARISIACPFDCNALAGAARGIGRRRARVRIGISATTVRFASRCALCSAYRPRMRAIACALASSCCCSLVCVSLACTNVHRRGDASLLVQSVRHAHGHGASPQSRASNNRARFL